MADEPEFSAPVGELPSSPAVPSDGTAPPSVDSDFIMNTLFGQDAPSEPATPKPAGDQGSGTKPDGGADTGTAPQLQRLLQGSLRRFRRSHLLSPASQLRSLQPSRNLWKRLP